MSEVFLRIGENCLGCVLSAVSSPFLSASSLPCWLGVLTPGSLFCASWNMVTIPCSFLVLQKLDCKTGDRKPCQLSVLIVYFLTLKVLKVLWVWINRQSTTIFQFGSWKWLNSGPTSVLVQKAVSLLFQDFICLGLRTDPWLPPLIVKPCFGWDIPFLE